MSRWPDPIREPLPVGLIAEQDIQDALHLAIRHTCEPEDPAFDATTHGALAAAMAALVECAEVLSFCRVDRDLHGHGDERREWERFGKEYVARKVARRVIDDLRKWLPS